MALRNKIKELATQEGYENISDFVEPFIKEGNYFCDFQFHLAEQYGLYYSYDGLYSAIRNDLNFTLQGIKKKKKLFNQARIKILIERDGFKKQAIGKKWLRKVSLLGFTSLADAIEDLEKRFLKIHVAEMLGVSYQHYCLRKRMIKKLNENNN